MSVMPSKEDFTFLKVRSPSVRGLKHHASCSGVLRVSVSQSPLPISSGIETRKSETLTMPLAQAQSPLPISSGIETIKVVAEERTPRILKVRSPSVRGLKR